MRWAIDEVSNIDPDTGLGETVGYVEADSQPEAMEAAADQGLMKNGLYSARPADG